MIQRTSNLPLLDMSRSTTGCCPKFDPAQWDGKVFEFRDKPFMRDHTVSFLHIPLNMGRVMARLQRAAEAHDAVADDFVLLSQEVSPWRAEHYYAVNKEVPGAQMVRLSGSYFAKVYEGAFQDAPKWHDDLLAAVKERGLAAQQTYFYYTTCPKCAKVYGKNYVVGMAKIG